MSKKSAHASRRKTPWDKESERTPMQEFLYQNYVNHYQERHPPLNETGEVELINTFRPESCPFCKTLNFKRFGYTGNGIQRYKCNLCGQTFTPITGTIFEGHKIALSEWMDYMLNLFRYVSINADSWNNRNAFTTSRYWLEKIFLVLEDYQNEIMLSDRVWLDETFYRVRSEDVAYSADGGKLRGLSKNQLCIGVACDKEKVLCVLEGTGKPSQKKTYEAFKDHIVPRSTLVHDKENAHKRLVEKLELVSEAYDSRKLKGLSDKDNPLNRVNHAHMLLKVFLYAHTSFLREKTQGYLNLFALVMNPPLEPLEKVDLLMNLAFKSSKKLRYRDFYGKR